MKRELKAYQQKDGAMRCDNSGPGSLVHLQLKIPSSSICRRPQILGLLFAWIWWGKLNFDHERCSPRTYREI